jgi:flagellar biogenesis protein FliO
MMTTWLIPLLCALGGASVGALVTRWFHRNPGDSSLRDPSLRVVSEVALDRRRSLALVESSERTWLLGLMGRHVTMLSEMKGGGNSAPPSGRHAFGRRLTENLAQKNQEQWAETLDATANRIFGEHTAHEEGLDPLMALASASPAIVRHPPRYSETQ